MSKHHLSNASELYYGDAYDPALFGNNARKGVKITPVIQASLGSPIALDTNAFVAAATSTELPNAATITYTTANAAVSPIDDAGLPATTSLALATGAVSVWPLDVPRNITAAATHATSVVAMTITVTGYDQYLQLMVEQLDIAATGTSQAAAGKKAFKYIKSIAITSAGNATTNTLNMGFADVLGLPYKVTAKSSIMQAWFNNVYETTAPTVVVADTNTPTATTGDVRGTIDTNSAMNGSPVVVYMIADPDSRTSLLGLTQFAG